MDELYLLPGPAIQFSLEPLTTDHGIPLAILGIVVVFFALCLVATMITLLPRVLRYLPDEHSDVAVSAPATTGDELPEETVAVIAAAVAAVITHPHRIVRVRGLTPGETGWMMEGRMQQHQSHRIQHRTKR